MSIASVSILDTGLQDALTRLDAASRNIAVAGANPPASEAVVTSEALPNGQGVRTSVQLKDSVFGPDLVTETVNMKLASLGAEANIKALKTMDEVLGTLVDDKA